MEQPFDYGEQTPFHTLSGRPVKPGLLEGDGRAAQALATAPIPPQNLDAEESVLGAMMLSPLAIGAVTESTNLSAADFYRESHGHVYKAILALYAKGEPVDAITVVDELDRTLDARRRRRRRSACTSSRRSSRQPRTRRTTRGSSARWRRCAG